MHVRSVLLVCATLVATPCPSAVGQRIMPAAGPVPPRAPAPPPAPTPTTARTEPVASADATPPAAEAGPTGPRPITAAEYGKWESLRRPILSPDGRWLAYQISRSNDDDELRLRMLATDATETFAHGARPAFSADGRWLAFIIGVSAEQREQAAKSGTPAPQKLGLHNLVDGRTDEIENVAAASFADDGSCLVIQRPRGKDQKHDGVDIVIRRLETGVDTAFGNVASHAWTDDRPLVAMLIDTEDGVGNGVQVFDAATGRLHTLDSAENGYATMAWREDAADLAVLRATKHDAKKDEEPSHVVIAWRGLDTDQPQRRTYDHRKDDQFPADTRVVDFAGLRWSDDGETLFFGIAPWNHAPADGDADEAAGDDANAPTDGRKDGGQDDGSAPDDGAEAKRSGRGDAKKQDVDRPLRETLKDPANVEVWHASDVDIIPLQKRTEARDRRESHLCAWWPETGTFVRLGTELTEDVALMEGHKRAIGMDNTPHEQTRMFGPTLHDLYVIDVATGERRRILEAVKQHDESCASGRYLLFVRDERIWSYDLDTDATVDLTGGLEPAFVNQEMSTLTEEKPAYGYAGWTEDGAHVLAYDRFDVWMLAADGSAATRLTRGAEKMIRHRRLVLDREAEEFIDPAATMYLSLYGEQTKKSGYARMRPGEPPEVLRWDDRRISGLVKAEDADVYAWTEERFDDSPDVYVDGPDLAGARQVTRTNPFQDEHLWGRSELVDYVNDHGEALQGALFYPAGYEPGRTYPMIVYIYERLSQTVHGYTAPSELNPYNTAVFTSQGYFVFRPDIVYRPQNPGLSAVACVVPAVRAVIDTGMIDEQRIGLIGHSWGAYQTAFIVTQTDLFAAGIAGAPLTNMMSMSMSVYWNSGETNAWIFHESQGRMDRPFWQDVDTYIRNSPIFSIDRLETPLMIAFGTEDGAVDFNQGVELYNAARLAGKQLVMLVYPGENHGLRQKPNQVDYHYRVLEWFGHYLKGEEAKPWILEGVDHLDRQKQIEAMKKESGKGNAPGGRGGGPGRRR